jgi:divalent metal cation (Fe/Co/Zn/Cd) transporter
MREAVTKILGEEPKQKLIDDITAEIKNIYKEDLHVHHFHIHNYISHKEITFHIRLNKEISIGTGHHVASAIEDMILEKFKMAATIHVEPLEEQYVHGAKGG